MHTFADTENSFKLKHNHKAITYISSTMMHPILLVAFLVAAYFCGSQSENVFSHYWEEHIGPSHPPHWLTEKASPLCHPQEKFFMKLIEENKLASHLHSFCKQANIVCSKNAPLETRDNTMLPPIAQWSAIKVIYDEVPSGSLLSINSQGGLTFFRESMVKQGGFMHLPDLGDSMLNISFLPRSLSSKIPFSLAHIEQLKKLFGVGDDSKMEEYIKGTLDICEKSPIQGEQNSCVTSIEDLIDFATKKLGHHVSIWSTENAIGSYQNVTIGVVKLIYGNLSEPAALCHSQPFLFQVYYCHILPKVKIYTVEIHAQERLNHMIMACHYDTSTWNPNHLAFQFLGFGPGLIEVCHWINENGMVWTKNLVG